MGWPFSGLTSRCSRRPPPGCQVGCRVSCAARRSRLNSGVRPLGTAWQAAEAIRNGPVRYNRPVTACHQALGFARSGAWQAGCVVGQLPVPPGPSVAAPRGLTSRCSGRGRGGRLCGVGWPASPPPPLNSGVRPLATACRVQSAKKNSVIGRLASGGRRKHLPLGRCFFAETNSQARCALVLRQGASGLTSRCTGRTLPSCLVLPDCLVQCSVRR